LPEVPAIRPVVLRALGVPGEAEPGHRVEDLADRLVGRAGAVGVLDAEEEGPARVPGAEPVEEGRPGAPAMEVARGTGGKADADRLRHGTTILAEGRRASQAPRAVRGPRGSVGFLASRPRCSTPS